MGSAVGHDQVGQSWGHSGGGDHISGPGDGDLDGGRPVS